MLHLKGLLLLLSFSLIATAQPRQVQPDVSKTPIQPAQMITIQLSSDLATALEKFRRTLNKPPAVDPVTGVTTITPVYPTIADMVTGALSSPGGLFRRVLQQFPTDSIKSAKDVAEQAAKDASAAEEKALKTK